MKAYSSSDRLLHDVYNARLSFDFNYLMTLKLPHVPRMMKIYARLQSLLDQSELPAYHGNAKAIITQSRILYLVFKNGIEWKFVNDVIDCWMLQKNCVGLIINREFKGLHVIIMRCADIQCVEKMFDHLSALIVSSVCTQHADTCQRPKQLASNDASRHSKVNKTKHKNKVHNCSSKRSHRAPKVNTDSIYCRTPTSESDDKSFPLGPDDCSKILDVDLIMQSLLKSSSHSSMQSHCTNGHRSGDYHIDSCSSISKAIRNQFVLSNGRDGRFRRRPRATAYAFT